MSSAKLRGGWCGSVDPCPTKPSGRYNVSANTPLAGPAQGPELAGSSVTARPRRRRTAFRAGVLGPFSAARLRLRLAGDRPASWVTIALLPKAEYPQGGEIMRFTDKVVLATGSSRGIGKAIALAFAREGAGVIVAAKTAEPDPRLPGTIHETAREIESLGARALAVAVDLRHAEQIDALVTRSIETFGRVDILVNNAGAVSFGDVTHWTVKKFDLVMAVNVRAAFLLSRALLPGMRERDSGTVAMISPPVHPAASPGKAPYLISKAGMTMLAMAIAGEEADPGIAAFALWPVTAIETAATINFQMGDPTMWRKTEI